MFPRKFHIDAVSNNSLTDYLVGILYDARATTFRYIQDITMEELDWQPYEKWNSVGALLQHIIACDHYFRICFVEKRKLTPEEEKQLNPPLDLGEHVTSLKGKAPGYYLDELQASHVQLVEAVKNLSAEDLLRRWYEVYDKENGSDLAWILYHKAEDEVHHRGQISLLRKLYKQTREKRSERTN